LGCVVFSCTYHSVVAYWKDRKRIKAHHSKNVKSNWRHDLCCIAIITFNQLSYSSGAFEGFLSVVLLWEVGQQLAI